MALFGLFLATIGMDPVTGNLRYTFDTMILQDGFDFLILAMGVFGIGEILSNIEEKMNNELVTDKVTNIWPSLKDYARTKWSILRGTLVGFLVGLLPGGGAVISSMLAYAVEKKASKHPEEFGKGAIEGVAGPESANNAASSAAFIPMLTLGIPGNPAIAMIFTALLIQGVVPGPLLIVEHPNVFWGVVASMYIGNVMLLFLNLPLVGLWIQMLKVPYTILAPLVVMICSIGVYTTKNNPTDVILMFIFGVVGYLLRKFKFELGPLILAFVLGRIMERSLSQALLISHGDFSVFFTDSISATILLVVALMIVAPLFGKVVAKFKKPLQLAE